MDKKQKIIPRGKWVLVKPLSDEVKESKYGLILPDTEEREQKAQGVVESVGKEVVDIKAGDVVVYGAFAGENIKTQENSKKIDYKLLLDEDIIAFIK
jgi:co-chaperonin GroES (HSP10)